MALSPTHAAAQLAALLAAEQTPIPPKPPLVVPVAGRFSVGSTSYLTLQAAFDSVAPGGTVQATGTSVGAVACAFLRKDNVTLRGPVKMVAIGASAGGKAMIVQQGKNFVVEDVDASGMQVDGQNGAFIRMEANGGLTLRRCHVHDGQQGILTNNGLGMARVLLEDCVFERLGSGAGQSHIIYIGQVAELRIKGGRYNDAIAGHCIKSRAEKTIIEGAQIHEGRAARAIDLANGGVVEIANCDIRQTQETSNSDIISYGIEGKFWPQNSFHFYASNRITNTRKPAGAIFNFKFEPDVKLIENYATGTTLR